MHGFYETLEWRNNQSVCLARDCWVSELTSWAQLWAGACASQAAVCCHFYEADRILNDICRSASGYWMSVLLCEWSSAFACCMFACFGFPGPQSSNFACLDLQSFLLNSLVSSCTGPNQVHITAAVSCLLDLCQF